MFATHYHELMQLPERLQHARNYNVAVRETGDTVVFLHRLEPGGTDRSYGIHVAQLAGLPRRGRRAGPGEMLGTLEGEHRVVPGDAAAARADPAQLALFAEALPRSDGGRAPGTRRRRADAARGAEPPRRAAAPGQEQGR